MRSLNKQRGFISVGTGMAIGAGASLAGGYLGNQASAGQSRASRRWQRAENITNRGFQERMSSTAHQRQIQDMKLAGLNPILSAGGGSSSPGGSITGGGQAQQSDIITPAVSTAMQAKLLGANIKKMEAETDKIQKETSGPQWVEAQIKGLERLFPGIRKFIKSSAKDVRRNVTGSDYVHGSVHDKQAIDVIAKKIPLTWREYHQDPKPWQKTRSNK